jgi:hypothetical protein
MGEQTRNDNNNGQPWDEAPLDDSAAARNQNNIWGKTQGRVVPVLAFPALKNEEPA